MQTCTFLFQGPASPHRLAFPHPPHSRGLSRGLRNAALWRSFCFAKPLVRLYAARGVHCSLPAFAHAQSWPLLTNPQPFLATSPRETNTSACAKCESVPKGMVQQKSRNIRCSFFWCTIGDSPAFYKRLTGAFLPAGPAAGPSCSRHPMVHQIEPSLKDCNKKRAAISCNAYFGAPSVGALRIQSGPLVGL